MTDVAVRDLGTRPAASSNAATDRPSTHLPALDGLRGVAVLMVVAYHFTEDRTAWFRGGWIGVDVFFVLSGYLVTRLLLMPGDLGLADVAAFLQRRVARLVPALIPLLAAGAVCVLVDPGLLGRTVSGSQPAPVSLSQYATTWGLALSGFANLWVADGGTPVAALGHLWSLCVEWQFYVCWPFLVAALSRSKLLWFTIALAVLSACWPVLVYAGPAERPVVYFATATHVVALAAGSLVAQLPSADGRLSRPLLLVGWPALLLLALTLGETHVKYDVGVLLVAVTAGCLVYAHARESVAAPLLTCRPLRWVGDRSYGIYLWHLPVLCALAPCGTAIRLAGVAVAVAVAAVSYRWVEVPARRRLRTYQRATARH